MAQYVAQEIKNAASVDATKSGFGLQHYVATSREWRLDKYAINVQDTIDAMAISAAESSSTAAVVPRYISTAKVRRVGPCAMGCITTGNYDNGEQNWRAAPSNCVTFTAGVTLCETHYRLALNAARKAARRDSGTTTRGDASHCTGDNVHSVEPCVERTVKRRRVSSVVGSDSVDIAPVHQSIGSHSWTVEDAPT